MPPPPRSHPDSSPPGLAVSLFRAMLEKGEAQNRHWDGLALFHFAGLIAGHYRLSANDVLDEIETAPPSVIENARNPQGLTAVAFYLANMLGADGPALVPTIH